MLFDEYRHRNSENNPGDFDKRDIGSGFIPALSDTDRKMVVEALSPDGLRSLTVLIKQTQEEGLYRGEHKIP